jgi:hypothetical protein
MRIYRWSLLACLDIVDSVFVLLQVITPDVFTFGQIEGTLVERKHALAKDGCMVVFIKDAPRKQCPT